MKIDISLQQFIDMDVKIGLQSHVSLATEEQSHNAHNDGDVHSILQFGENDGWFMKTLS
jgi:hypothetical protein